MSPSSDKGGDLEAEKAIFPEMECKAKSNCSAMSCFVMIQEDKSGGVVSVSLSLCFLVLVVKSEDGPRCLLPALRLEGSCRAYQSPHAVVAFLLPVLG